MRYSKRVEPAVTVRPRRQAVYIHQRSVCLDVDLYYSLTAYAQIISEEIADGSRVNVSAAMRALLDSGLEDHRVKVQNRARKLEKAAKQAAIQFELDQVAARDQRKQKRKAKARAAQRSTVTKLPAPAEQAAEPPRQMKLVV
jgi:Arc/MetJ-type ribon-helix-helix transcriptional regulator